MASLRGQGQRPALLSVNLFGARTRKRGVSRVRDAPLVPRYTASVSGAVVRDPGRLQLDGPPGGIVHLRYRQAEPVPQAPEPFAAGPGDRLFQLPPVDGFGRAGGGAGHGCRTRRGQVAWVLLICGRIPGHCVLLGGLAGLCRAACLVSRWLVPHWAAAETVTTHNRPQDSPQDGSQESAGPAFLLAARRRRGVRADCYCASAAGSGRAWSWCHGNRRWRLTVVAGTWRGRLGRAYC